EPGLVSGRRGRPSAGGLPFASEADAEACHGLVGRRVAISAVGNVLVARAAILEPSLERSGQLHLQATAETQAAGVVVELFEGARGGERRRVERGVADLAVSGDARRQGDAGAGADVVLAV